MTEEDSKYSSKVIAIATCLITLTVAICGGVIWDVVSSTKVPTAPVTVASLEEDACAKFAEAELTCKQEWVTDESVQRFALVHQSLPPDSKVKKETPITLKYSKGPAAVKLMELRNETVENAQKELAPYGITVHEKSIVADSGLQDGRIVSTEPAAGESLKNGSKVEVIVANGKVNVPDWKGKARAIVEADVKEKTLNVVFKEEESDGPPNMVLSQSASGLLPLTDTITVTVSIPRQVQEIVIPKVIGQAPLTATSTLATAGFTRINVVTLEKEGAKEEKVIAVTPGEGSKVKSDTVVQLTVEKPKS